MSDINLSDVVMVVFFSILSQIPQTYLAYSAGISIKNEPIIAISILATIFGMSITGLIIVNYLRERVIEKHVLQTPLIASMIILLTQYLIFIWCLSSLINNILFADRFTDLFVFSQIVSIVILLITVAILTTQ